MKKLLLAVPVAALTLVMLAVGAAAQPTPAREQLFVGFGKAPGAAERALVERHGGTVRHAFPSVNALAIDLSSAKVGELAREQGVRYVEQDPPRYPLGLATSELTPSMSNGLYGLITTRAVNAHPTYTGSGVNSCVADTGIDADHVDIAGNYKGGYDAFARDQDPDVGNSASETHGTHVSGTVAAVRGNGAGVFGVAYGANLYVARVLGTQSDGSVSGSTSQVMDGVKTLAEKFGCRVINMSLGGGSKSRTEENLYKDLYNKGHLIVAAAGNDGSNRISYPAAYPVVVSVSAVDQNNVIASFSNRGRGLDLAGPGVLVVSSVSDGHGAEASVTQGATEYRAFGLEFAGKTGGFTDTLVDCGLATAASDCVNRPSDGTWVALIQRGSISFADKVKNATAAGADAAIIYNNAAGDFIGTLGAEGDWIPAVSVSDLTGAALESKVGENATVVNSASSWDHYDGTSMATPHVSGVATLVFGAKSCLKAANVEKILEDTARDLGAAGYDTTYGYGIPQADAATTAALSTACP